MSRPTDWSPLNWYQDPIPGDPDAVSRAATRYGNVAESIRQASRDLVRVFEDEQLKGESFDALREIATEVSGRIGRARERYQGVSDALADYVAPLRTAQSDSAGVLSQAVTNHSDQVTANDRVTYWDDEFRRLSMAGDPTAPDALEKLQYWEQRRAEASQDVTSLITQLNTIISTRDTAATTAANAIAEVENSGDLNDDFWDNVDQFLDEHGDFIDKVIEIAGYIAAALAVIAMFIPGLNLIVLIVGIVVAVAVVANAWAKAGTGRSSIAEALIQTALAVIPFGIGKGFSALASSARSNVMGSAVNSMLRVAPNSGNPGIRALTGDVALEGLELLAAANPSKAGWMSNFGDLMNLQVMSRGPILTNGGLSPAMQSAMPAAWVTAAMETAWDGAEPFVMNLTTDLVTGMDAVTSQPMNSWQNSNW